MDETIFQQEHIREIEAKQIARRVLGIGEIASPREIKRAWRRRCLETHPDRNPGDPDAERRFRLVNCAYRLLTEGTPCDELLTNNAESEEPPKHGKYNLSNAWGFYLWWRDRFF